MTLTPTIYGVAENAADAAHLLAFMNWVITQAGLTATATGMASMFGATATSGNGVFFGQFSFSVPPEHVAAVKTLFEKYQPKV